MAGLFLLLALCTVMALGSFLAGALPLSMTFSQSQLRLLSSIGVGILVGTSMIVIIPEGIEAATSPGEASHIHKIRSLARRGSWAHGVSSRETLAMASTIPVLERRGVNDHRQNVRDEVVTTIERVSRSTVSRQDDEPEPVEMPVDEHEEDEETHEHEHDEEEEVEVPKFEIGFSLVVGFILMFLIDRIPRHAADSLQPPPGPQHFSLDTLGGNGAAPSSSDEEADGFLGSFAPTPRKARSLATTIGLVIHAAADGIAMGASATSSNMKLGFIIFIAIMIHKAPAAFGLTAVLLRQGLSKRTARAHLIAFSLAAPIGAISTWLVISVLGGGHVAGDSWWTGMLLLFSGGTFLYVAMHAMQEDAGSHSHDSSSGANGHADVGTSVNQRKAKGPQMRDTMATMVGMLIPLLTQVWH